MAYPEILSLFLALYGAVLATILGIRELRKERRSILLYMEQWDHYEKFFIRIVNKGYRPVTIINTGLDVTHEGTRQPADTPWRSIDWIKIGTQLPITLNDGETKLLEISEQAAQYIYAEGYIWEVYARTAEGKRYTGEALYHYDPKRDEYY